MWRRAPLCSFCLLIFGIGGCPKRQGPTQIVYVPAPAPPAAEAPAETPQVLVIEEPAPVEAESVTPPPPATTDNQKSPVTTTRRASHAGTGAAAQPDETPPADAATPPAVEVPALEPRESTQQAEEMRQQIQRSLAEVSQRVSHIDEGRLSADQRKTLDDARTFYAQSARALESGDLQRALNLARKASLLVAALE